MELWMTFTIARISRTRMTSPIMLPMSAGPQIHAGAITQLPQQVKNGDDDENDLRHRLERRGQRQKPHDVKQKPKNDHRNQQADEIHRSSVSWLSREHYTPEGVKGRLEGD